jgi:arylsulfatase A-like enzyme
MSNHHSRSGVRRLASVVLPALLVTSAVAFRHQGLASASTPPPNIVFILTDDQRAHTLWAMPHVERLLVQHGVTFRKAYVVNSLCCPSRTSILTGNYSHTTGVYTNRYPDGGFERFTQNGEDQSTIATWLHQAGYETAMVGKYLNQYKEWTDGTYIPPGWDSWNAFYTNGAGAYYNYAMTLDGTVKDYGNRPSDYSTTVLTSDAVRFIEQARNPFFLYFATSAPHGPARPPPGDELTFAHLHLYRPASFNEADVSDKPAWVASRPLLTPTRQAAIDAFRRHQYQALLGVDDAVAQIVSALRDINQLHNTVIAFMSDNGFQWGEHRLGGKEKAYEESIHVPLVIRYDGLGDTPRVEDRLALNIDLAPTFAALAGASAPPTDGVSLMPILESQPVVWRSDFLIEHLIFSGTSVPSYCAVHTDRYVLIRYQYGDGTKEDELYDLRADPRELLNVAADPAHSAVRDELLGRLQQLCNPPPPGTNLP